MPVDIGDRRVPAQSLSCSRIRLPATSPLLQRPDGGDHREHKREDEEEDDRDQCVDLRQPGEGTGCDEAPLAHIGKGNGQNIRTLEQRGRHDFVFVGDLGRPDLLDEAAGGVDTRFEGAKQLFHSLREKLLTLPDYVQIFPAHGSGSACGKALGAVPTTTVGYERNFSWWGRHLAADDEQGFIDELLEGQPDAPAYFSRMKRQNRDGPQILGHRDPLPELDAEVVKKGVEEATITFVDTRSQHEVHRGTIPGSINVPVSGKPAAHAGWAYDPEADSRPLVLLARDQDLAQLMWDHLIRVGIDDVTGFVSSLEELPVVIPEMVSPSDLSTTDYDLLLDVRNASEYAAGSIPGAKQLSAGRVLWHQDELPENATIVTFCQSGVRNSVASSALRRAGHRVVELEGSYLGWQAAQK